MSAGNKEKAPDGGLENLQETENPPPPGAMSSEKENAAVNLMETESKK